jgi:hypothetical protein
MEENKNFPCLGDRIIHKTNWQIVWIVISIDGETVKCRRVNEKGEPLITDFYKFEIDNPPNPSAMFGI